MACHTLPHDVTSHHLLNPITHLKEQMVQERDKEKSEALYLDINLDDWSIYPQGLTKEDLSLTDFTALHNHNSSPPYDIERPNCVPGVGSFSISDFRDDEEEEVKDDKLQQDNVHDLFESLFAPISTIPTIQKPDILMATSPSLKICPSQSPTSSPSKLSLLFKKKPKNDPHFVKFQTWSKQHRVLEDQSSEANEQMSWIHFLEEEQADLSLITPPVKTRPRSSTDASLIPVASPLVTTQQHSRCKSIGFLLDPPLTNHPVKSLSTEDEGLALLDKAGHLLARYKLGNVIGKGHFGTVYRALDLMSGKTVAVKQISLKDARKGDIEDMMQEASLLSSLTHPNIVKYEGFIQTEDHMNIALEFVENGSLLHTLKHFGGALPEHLVAGYCYDILQGLVYLHQQDVVHCDLKAANILTTKTGDVKLSDFGVSLSLKLKDKDDETIVSGTPFWMSPEVIELKGASVQSDIWSLGCTVIELCTGKPPYADLIAMTAMFRIVEDDCPPLPTDISDDLLDFLKLCFKKNPVERPRAVHLVHHPWITQHRAHTNYNYWHQMTQSPNKWNHHINHTYPMPTKSSMHHSPLLNRMMSQQKKQKRASSLSRQSMPTLGLEDHQHTLIECSFPKGVGQCKLCTLTIKNEAFVCSDFCGFVCHKQCKSNYSPTVLEDLHSATSSSYGPRPTGSISSQLRDKFSISKILPSYHYDTNPILSEDEPPSFTSKWWKKKP